VRRLRKSLCLLPVLVLASVTVFGRQAQFRTVTDVVTVDVSVTDQGRPVTGLSADDFEIFDGDRREPVEHISLGRHPLDVTILLDVSDSMDKMAPGAPLLLASVLTKIMQPDDLVDVVPFATVMFPGDESPGRHYTALLDAVVAAALRPHPATHRRLVVVLSDGFDNASGISDPLMRDALASVDAVVSVVRVVNSGAAGRLAYFGSGEARADLVAKAIAKPLADLSASTGGEFLDFRSEGAEDALRGADVARMVVNVIEGFRQRYVLRFVPSDRSPGLHQLRIRVPGTNYVITHRSAYWQPGVR